MIGTAISIVARINSLLLAPLAIAIHLVDQHGFLVISRNLVPVLVAWPVAEVLEANLVDSSTQGLGVLDIPLATSPAISIQKSILLSIHRDSHWIVFEGKG